MSPGEKYHKVNSSIWLKPWDDDVRHVALYLLTCQHRTTEGLFRLPVEYAVGDLGWPTKRFKRAFHELCRHGFVSYDQQTSVCLIEGALPRHAPLNSKQAIGAVNAVSQIPPCSLRDRWVALAEQVSTPLIDALRERMPDWFVYEAEFVSDANPEFLSDANVVSLSAANPDSYSNPHSHSHREEGVDVAG